MKRAVKSRTAVEEPRTIPATNAGTKPATRVLIASHSHPQLSKGGAEIAAHVLFSALLNRPGYKTSFLGGVRDQMNQKMGATISQPFSDDEYLYAGGAFDWFKFSNNDPNFPGAFRALLEKLKPQIAHFHHYIVFGVETFLHIRKMLPDCRIVLTLHEYLAICNHYGQMITTQHRTLCYQASPLACSRCFKEITPSDFFLRNLYIRRFFDLVDHFISPSQFLAERYVAWGIPQEKISVIENVTDRSAGRLNMDPSNTEKGNLRVGFFGQISTLKGINVFLDAAEFLEKKEKVEIIFEIFGDYSGAPPDFQKVFLERLAKAGRNVLFNGPYEQNRVDHLMQSVDVVVMPSIWWENSPVVIQEALRNRTPVICSDLGGMAEKVRDGVDGFHFPVGNAIALAGLLMKLADDPAKLVQVRETMREPPQAEDIISTHEKLYASLVS